MRDLIVAQYLDGWHSSDVILDEDRLKEHLRSQYLPELLVFLEDVLDGTGFMVLPDSSYYPDG